MGVAIVVSPTIIVMVSSIGGNEFFHEFLQVLYQAGFEFNCRQCRGRTRDKNRGHATLNLFFLDVLANFGRDIDDVTEARGLFRKFLGVNLYHAIR